MVDDLPQGDESVDLDPADLTTNIDNPYWPMEPGTRWTYREVDEDGSEVEVVVTVTTETEEIANGITARPVRDTVTEDNELIEGHLRLVCTGRRRQHLVPRGGHRRVQE